MSANPAGYSIVMAALGNLKGFYSLLYKQLVTLLISSVLLACSSSQSNLNSDESEATTRRADCILRSSIRGYSVLDESNLIVDGSGRRKYHVVLSRRAYGLRSSWGIAFNSSTGRICASFSDVSFDGNMGNESIRIASIRELSPEDHNDLLIRYGKKKPEIEQTPAPLEGAGAEVEELDPAAKDDPSGD